MAIDIFDVDETVSILRERIREKGEINLRELEIPPYEIDPYYKTERFRFSPGRLQYLREIRKAIAPISEIAESRDYDHNVFTALYEAVLNAHQHGNERDPNKGVEVAYNIEDDVARFAIVDQGGKIDPEFLSFVLRHREGRHKRERNVRDFYAFAQREKPRTNNGTGIYFMHLYMDDVSFFKHIDGGLVVHLTKKKRSSS